MTDWNQFREITALRDSGHAARALLALQNLRKSATEPADISSILLAESIAHRDLGQFDEAARAASKAIELLPQESPSRPYAEFSLACIHESEAKFDLAVQEFKALLKKHTKLLSTGEYVQFRRGVQLRLIANLIVLGHGVEQSNHCLSWMSSRARMSHVKKEPYFLTERPKPTDFSVARIRP